MSELKKYECGESVDDCALSTKLSPHKPVEIIHNKRKIVSAVLNKRDIDLAYFNDMIIWQAYLYLYLLDTEVIVPQSGTVEVVVDTNTGFKVE